MLRRLFTFLVVVVLLLGCLYYWQRGSFKLGDFKDIKDIKAPDFKNLAGSIKDVAITGSVKTALSLNRELRPYTFEVETKEGVVALRGAVPSAQVRMMAEEVSGAVPNVKKVTNELRVDTSVKAGPNADRTIGARLDDETLEVQVKLALTLKKELENSSIHVAVLEKVVTLSGQATAAQKAAAMKTAEETPGVVSVTDGFGAPSGGKGRAAVEHALAANANLAPYHIRVMERGDRLVLVGNVRTGAERDLAAALAEAAAGGPIENSLALKP
jgi:hyperosmotically inducible protein